MNGIYARDVSKLADIMRRRTNEREAGLWEFRFKGKPEGSPAVTRYPNLLAEMFIAGYEAEDYANAANVSYPVFAAVIEDGERLTPKELDGVRRLIARGERGGDYDSLSLDYLLSPALSCIDPKSNKGKFLRRKFEQAKAEADSRAYRYLTPHETNNAHEVELLLAEPYSFYYAAYRQTINQLQGAITCAAILESARKERERAALTRRERRFDREEATV